MRNRLQFQISCYYREFSIIENIYLFNENPTALHRKQILTEQRQKANYMFIRIKNTVLKYNN